MIEVRGRSCGKTHALFKRLEEIWLSGKMTGRMTLYTTSVKEAQRLRAYREEHFPYLPIQVKVAQGTNRPLRLIKGGLSRREKGR